MGPSLSSARSAPRAARLCNARARRPRPQPDASRASGCCRPPIPLTPHRSPIFARGTRGNLQRLRHPPEGDATNPTRRLSAPRRLHQNFTVNPGLPRWRNTQQRGYSSGDHILERTTARPLLTDAGRYRAMPNLVELGPNLVADSGPSVVDSEHVLAKFGRQLGLVWWISGQICPFPGLFDFGTIRPNTSVEIEPNLDESKRNLPMLVKDVPNSDTDGPTSAEIGRCRPPRQ